jgi:hypothetical protein
LRGILWCVCREISVAVEAISRYRHHEERTVLIEHRSPGVYPADLIDKEAPAHLTDILRAGTVERESSDGRVDPVGADDQAILTR